MKFSSRNLQPIKSLINCWVSWREKYTQMRWTSHANTIIIMVLKLGVFMGLKVRPQQYTVWCSHRLPEGYIFNEETSLFLRFQLQHFSCSQLLHQTELEQKAEGDFVLLRCSLTSRLWKWMNRSLNTVSIHHFLTLFLHLLSPSSSSSSCHYKACLSSPLEVINTQHRAVETS